MSNNIDQYNAIRAAIASNLDTIRSLLAQANNLNMVVTGLDGNVEPTERKKLEDSMNNLYKSIDLLIMQTDTLFKTFIVYANTKENVRA